MNAKEYKLTFSVTVELLVTEGVDIGTAAEAIKDRIKEQLAGHRTNQRLADKVNVMHLRTKCIATREI